VALLVFDGECLAVELVLLLVVALDAAGLAHFVAAPYQPDLFFGHHH